VKKANEVGEDIDTVKPLLELLLRSELARMTTCPLAAVSGTGGKTGVALAANLLVALVLGGENFH